MKRILVTGATGGLGRHAVELLLRRGCEVRALGRDFQRGARLQAMGASFTPLDLATVAEDGLRPVLEGVDAVWHCAARTALWGRHADYMADNCEATVKLARASAAAGVQRFVFVSTPAVDFDFTHRYAVPEHFRPARYANSYAYSKAMAEQALQRNDECWRDMRVAVLPPRAIVGPYDRSLLPRLERLQRCAGGSLASSIPGRRSDAFVQYISCNAIALDVGSRPIADTQQRLLHLVLEAAHSYVSRLA